MNLAEELDFDNLRKSDHIFARAYSNLLAVLNNANSTAKIRKSLTDKHAAHFLRKEEARYREELSKLISLTDDVHPNLRTKLLGNVRDLHSTYGFAYVTATKPGRELLDKLLADVRFSIQFLHDPNSVPGKADEVYKGSEDTNSEEDFYLTSTTKRFYALDAAFERIMGSFLNEGSLAASVQNQYLIPEHFFVSCKEF